MKTIFHRTLKTIHRLSLKLGESKSSKPIPDCVLFIDRQQTEYSWTEPSVMDDYGRSKAGPSQFSSIGREKSAVAKWRRWNHRHKIRPIVFPESSGGMLFSTTYIFPDTSKYRDSFRTVPSPGQIFRHIRWAETNFKTFLLSSLQLKLSSAVTDPSPDSSHSSHEPRTFLSFFLFDLLQGATLQGKTLVE